VVQGQLRLATEECDSERLAKFKQAHDRMETLIDDLLMLAQDGQTIGEREPVVLRSVVTDGWRTVGTDDTTLPTETDEVIKTDRSRLQQVLENLIRSAANTATRV
jgi:signal transduction histidine kinase